MSNAAAAQPLDSAVLAQPASPPIHSLGHRAARGVAWMIAQNVLSKVVSTLGQIAIAVFLIDKDFGLAMLAWTFSIPATLIQQGGLKEVLIQRHRHFRRWGNPAFWMSMGLGLAGGAFMAISAPLAARWFHEPRLFGLLLVIAVLFPLESLSIVPMARIQADLRFRLVAVLTLAQAIVQTLLSILLAWQHFGPYSLLLPRLAVVAMTAVVCWWAATPALRPALQVRRWRFLVGDGARALGAYGCDLAAQYAPYLILSILYNVDAAGRYFFAFNLSLQTIVLVTLSLGGVLFPALTKMRGESGRQAQAFLRAVRLLGCIAIPACFLQAAAANPGMHLVFKSNWYVTIPLVQIMSIAMALRAVGRPAGALMQAQNRFGTQFRLALVSLVLFIVLATIGAWKFQELGVAMAVALHILIMDPIALYIAVRPGGFGWKDVRRALVGPFTLGIACVAPAALAGWFVPDFRGADVVRCLAIGAVAAMLYIPLFRVIVPDAWDEARGRVRALLGRA